ncbi:hypothetical protein AMECASPLE_030347 [Ameca splendens]|uniref:Uncharacterized protein n=1 Tax=Ameca splendens TaxID=208324 RepID=A0ABV1A2T3_9TELE
MDREFGVLLCLFWDAGEDKVVPHAPSLYIQDGLLHFFIFSRQLRHSIGAAEALEIWRLTVAACLVISHGAIKGRTASTSAADCFAPVVLLSVLTGFVKKPLESHGP